MTIKEKNSACTDGKGIKASDISEKEFHYVVDTFADLQVLRYKVSGFDSLSLAQKQLLYHLSEAALMGRDILFDQNGRYNLSIRRTLEAIYLSDNIDHKTAEFKALETYLKRVWFSNGIHHHYAEDKLPTGFSQEFFIDCIHHLPENLLPLRNNQTKDQFIAEITPVLFDKNFLAKRTVQSTHVDIIKASSNNYYAGDLSEEEVSTFYAKLKDPQDLSPISYGLNSRLVKNADGSIEEKVWKVGGLYTQALEKVVEELQKAVVFAENDVQKAVIETLISFYQSGDLHTFDAYAIRWVEDLSSEVDFVNGFTETYGDPLGIKASWEATVNFVNKEATKRTKTISQNAQWFEDHSPVDNRFRKKKVKGVSAKVITMAMLGGDCYPTSPLGINLPNADWIRRDHGSKSVTIENISEAYEKASQGNGMAEEFMWSDVERNAAKQYRFLTDNLHTDLHECLGHGSGQLLKGVSSEALKAYGAPLEEARADLFGLYYIADSKMVELGLLPDMEAYKAGYYNYMMNGLMTQLVRIEKGKNIEQAHMRNRQLITRWVLQEGQADKVVELKKREGKTYVVVNDYAALRSLFGKLLAEIQRIKSEGDYEAGKELVEHFGIKVDTALHAEILERYAALDLAPYKGFVNPVMKQVKDSQGIVSDIILDYNEGYTEQMLRYSKDYSFLPNYN